jgi:LuxR family maltose regulon positive regulatory protein
LIDYLWDEVVLGQPRTIRHFLMRTAILDRLTVSLCDAVTERDDSEEMLRELERANLFVVPLDSGRTGYRYHHLFRDLLLRQLERFAADVIPDLHRRASTWFGSEDMMVEAIGHALAAGDVNYAADELERHWLEFYSTGQATTILEWIDRLPPETLAGHATLILARGGIARALGRLEEAEEWLARGDALAATLPRAASAARSREVPRSTTRCTGWPAETSRGRSGGGGKPSSSSPWMAHASTPRRGISSASRSSTKAPNKPRRCSSATSSTYRPVSRTCGGISRRR